MPSTCVFQADPHPGNWMLLKEDLKEADYIRVGSQHDIKFRRPKAAPPAAAAGAPEEAVKSQGGPTTKPAGDAEGGGGDGDDIFGDMFGSVPNGPAARCRPRSC